MKTIRRKYKRRLTCRYKNKKYKKSKKVRQSLRQKKSKTKKIYNYMRSNKILYQSGGEGDDDNQATQEDVDFVKEIIQENIDLHILPESISPDAIVEDVAVSDPVDICRRPEVPRPKKTSLFGKLIEILFARKQLGLEGDMFAQFLSLPPNSKYDIPAIFTMHLGSGSMYFNCNLSLKSKELKSEGSHYNTGNIETGDAVTFLECLIESLFSPSTGFKIVVEDYYCKYEPGTKKMIGLKGKYRRVYDLKDQLGAIFGGYDSVVEIKNLYDKILGLKQRCPIIMANKDTSERTIQLLDLKRDIDRLNHEMARNNCLIFLARKQASNCKTFTGDGTKPALRVQSALIVNRLNCLLTMENTTDENLSENMGFPLSPHGVRTPKTGVTTYTGFKNVGIQSFPKRSIWPSSVGNEPVLEHKSPFTGRPKPNTNALGYGHIRSHPYTKKRSSPKLGPGLGLDLESTMYPPIFGTEFPMSPAFHHDDDK